MENENQVLETPVTEQPQVTDVTTQQEPSVQATQPVPQEQPSVVETATPMDNNVTYNNIPDETLNTIPLDTTFDDSKSIAQNMIADAVNVQHTAAENNNAGTSMNKFLTQDYDYNHDEAGSYWVAGAINDNETQMSFLNTLINEEMYDEMDLQKYYYDTNMASARAYAAQKSKETAYGYYKAAQEKALAEGQLTGWYMPAEGQYMLGQYSVAQTKLEDPNISDLEKAKANRVTKTTEEWFKANQISTRGIKCLSMMNYEEVVRNNTIMGNLKKEANAIQRAGVAAQGAAADLQLREYKFKLEEMEMATGINLTKAVGLDNDNYIGHNVEKDYPNLQALAGFKSTEDMLRRSPERFEQVLYNRGREYIKNVFRSSGVKDSDIKNYFDKYDTIVTERKIIDNKLSSNIIESDYKHSNLKISSTNKIKDIGSDKSIYIIPSKQGDKYVSTCYYKDKNGLFKQIKDSDIKLQNGKTLDKYVSNFSDKTALVNNKKLQVGDIVDRSKLEGSITKNKDMYTNLHHKDKIAEWEAKGYHLVDGKYSTKGINANIVMKNDDGEYIEISDVQGKDSKINKKDLKNIKVPKDKVFSDTNNEYFKERSKIIGTKKEKGPSILSNTDFNINYYSFTDADGNTIYYKDKLNSSNNERTLFEKVSEAEINRKFSKAYKDIENKDKYKAKYKAKKNSTKGTNLNLGSYTNSGIQQELNTYYER